MLCNTGKLLYLVRYIERVDFRKVPKDNVNLTLGSTNGAKQFRMYQPGVEGEVRQRKMVGEVV